MDLALSLGLALSNLCGMSWPRCTIMDSTRAMPSFKEFAGEIRPVRGGFIAVSADSQQVIWCQCEEKR